ncbi:MAG: DUF488 family protein [Flavisolibacter sp.]
MFYRRKIILALLQIFEGELDKIRLQKLLFLFAKQQAKPEYNFIPYRFGCYSYSANADMTAMVRKGILAENKEAFTKTDMADYLTLLKPEDRRNLSEIKALYGKMSANALMKHTYLNYPFYAIKSEVAERLLDTEELQEVKRATPRKTDTVLFTIGYQGISLEEYLVRLIKNDIRILVDVRNNPMSMKYGFSKSQLKKYCESIGIAYIHFPEVGIQSEQRQELNSQLDYDRLFKVYCDNNLTATGKSQTQILELLKKHERIALTCFEANICQCHRKHLAEAIERLPGFSYEVKHI